jgi:hypothetical protein
MNKRLITAATLGIASLLLQACSSTPATPQLTPQERAERAKATLNVYEDNRVWFKSVSGVSQSHYGWTNDGKDIMALLIDGRAYNAKDIATITPTEARHGYQIAVVLRSGEKISAFLPAGGDNVVWLACDTQKVCPQRSRLDTSNYNNQFHRILTGIYEGDLLKTPDRDPKYELVTDSRTTPVRSSVRFLAGAEIDELRGKFARQQERWAQLQAQRAQKQEADRVAQQARERAIESEAVETRKRIRVGAQTNCGQVFEVRLPMVGVQTAAGMQFIDISRLYGPSAGCRFVNGQYVGR